MLTVPISKPTFNCNKLGTFVLEAEKKTSWFETNIHTLTHLMYTSQQPTIILPFPISISNKYTVTKQKLYRYN